MDAKKRLSPYEVSQKERDASRASDAEWQAEMRAKAKQTIANLEAQEKQAALEKQAADEAAFKSTECEKYIAAGGSQIQFNEDWLRLRQEIVERRFRGGESAPLSDSAAAAKRHLDLLYKRD